MKAPARGVKWMRILHEPQAHCVTADGAGESGWRPLCQQSDMASELLVREAIDGRDEFCDTCRRVVASRIRMAIRKRRRGLVTRR